MRNFTETGIRYRADIALIDIGLHSSAEWCLDSYAPARPIRIIADQTWGSGSTRIEGLVLSFVGRGRIDLSLDDQNFALGSGRLAIVRPWQRHALGRPCVTASRYHWVVLDLGVRQPNNAWLWPPWLILSQEERDRLALLLHRNEQPVLQANQAVRDCLSDAVGAVVVVEVLVDVFRAHEHGERGGDLGERNVHGLGLFAVDGHQHLWGSLAEKVVCRPVRSLL